MAAKFSAGDGAIVAVPPNEKLKDDSLPPIAPIAPMPPVPPVIARVVANAMRTASASEISPFSMSDPISGVVAPFRGTCSYPEEEKDDPLKSVVELYPPPAWCDELA